MNAAYLLDRLGKTIAERDAAIARVIAAAEKRGTVAGLREAQEIIREGVEEQTYGIHGPIRVRRSKSMMETLAAISSRIAALEKRD